MSPSEKKTKIDLVIKQLTEDLGLHDVQVKTFTQAVQTRYMNIVELRNNLINEFGLLGNEIIGLKNELIKVETDLTTKRQFEGAKENVEAQLREEKDAEELRGKQIRAHKHLAFIARISNQPLNKRVEDITLEQANEILSAINEKS